MKISILDDYLDTLRALDGFSRLSGHDGEVVSDHVQDGDVLAERMRETEALVLVRERTEIRAHSSLECRSSGSSTGAASTRTWPPPATTVDASPGRRAAARDGGIL